MPENPRETPRSTPEIVPAETPETKETTEQVEFSDLREALQQEVTTERIESAIDQNVLSPETAKEEVEKAANDPKRLELFEALAFLLAYLVNKGWSFDQGTLDFFHTVDDDNEHDVEPEKSSRRERRRESRQRDIELGEGRAALVDAAHGLVNSTAFRGPEVDGGNLACAQVASTALVEAGYLDAPILGVTRTVQELKRRGWKAHSGPGHAGDVVVWNRTRSTNNDGEVKLGHGHIGIVVDNNLCVSNSSGKRMPRLHNMGEEEKDGYWYSRGISMYLSPPEA